MSAEPGRTALVIVDMQNGFLDAKGSMARIGMSHERLTPAIEGCVRLVAAAREAGLPVIFTRYVYLPGYADGGIVTAELLPAMREAQALILGSWDADIIEELTPRADEIIIDKSRPSSFYGTRLEPVLTGLGITALTVAGITTNVCVETTVRDAGQRDYRTTVASDATAEYDDTRHEVALGTMGYLFGWVKTVDEIIAGWRANAAA